MTNEMTSSRSSGCVGSVRDWALWSTAALGILFAGCDPSEPPDGGPLDPPMCGGIAGVECPGAGDCVDDPSDDCDPEMGGADCGGLCECNAIGLCTEGFVWDSSPHVCGCVADYDPCIATLCPVGTLCVSEGGQAECVPFDGGAGPGTQCGDAVCGDGLVCCNASCGICTEPDGACIQIACEGEE